MVRARSRPSASGRFDSALRVVDLRAARHARSTCRLHLVVLVSSRSADGARDSGSRRRRRRQPFPSTRSRTCAAVWTSRMACSSSPLCRAAEPTVADLDRRARHTVAVRSRGPQRSGSRSSPVDYDPCPMRVETVQAPARVRATRTTLVTSTSASATGGRRDWPGRYDDEPRWPLCVRGVLRRREGPRVRHAIVDPTAMFCGDRSVRFMRESSSATRRDGSCLSPLAVSSTL
jgi:hypothetical protein